MEINFSQKQSNAIQYLTDTITSEVFFGGGAGSGKSLFGCLWHIGCRVKYAGTRGLIGRAKLSVLKESTLITYFKACGLLGYQAGEHYTYNAQDHFVQWANGSRTVFKDLFFYPSDPDFQSLGSTEYTDVFIDEAPEITEKAFDIVNSRIRWMLHEYGLVPKILLTGNPGPHWIKKKYVKNDQAEWLDLKPYQKRVLATILDNPDPQFVKLYRAQLEKINNDYDRKRLLGGDWDAKPKTGGEWAHKFNYIQHTGKVPFLPESTVHLTFDFNSLPYMTMLCAQIVQRQEYQEIRFFQEYCLKNPRNSVKGVCNAFINDYGIHKPSVFFYGDASGNSRIPGMGDRTNFDDVRETLSPLVHNKSNRTMRFNPSVMKRRDLLNEIFDEKLPVRILIDKDRCPTFIQDLSEVVEGISGKLKVRITDTLTGASYEKNGHFTDAFEYMLVSLFENYLRK